MHLMLNLLIILAIKRNGIFHSLFELYTRAKTHFSFHSYLPNSLVACVVCLFVCFVIRHKTNFYSSPTLYCLLCGPKNVYRFSSEIFIDSIPTVSELHALLLMIRTYNLYTCVHVCVHTLVGWYRCVCLQGS